MAKKSSMHRNRVIGKVLIYILLILITAIMVVPFLWMLSASIKTNTEVFDIHAVSVYPGCSSVEQLPGDLDEDTTGKVYRKHGVPHGRGYDTSDADEQLRGIRVCKASVQTQKRSVPGVHSDDRNALAGVHGAAVHHDARDGAQ